MKHNNGTSIYEQIGRRALLPGLVRAKEILEAEIAAISGDMDAEPAAPRKSERKSNGSALYWARLTPAQREAEMARRWAKRQNSASTAEAKVKGGRNKWASMTVRQQKAHIAKMQAGRGKKANGVAAGAVQ